MNEMEFRKYSINASIICISDYGVFDSMEDVEKEIKDGISSVLEDIVESYNDVFKFEISDGLVRVDGSDKSD